MKKDHNFCVNCNSNNVSICILTHKMWNNYRDERTDLKSFNKIKRINENKIIYKMQRISRFGLWMLPVWRQSNRMTKLIRISLKLRRFKQQNELDEEIFQGNEDGCRLTNFLKNWICFCLPFCLSFATLLFNMWKVCFAKVRDSTVAIGHWITGQTDKND